MNKAIDKKPLGLPEKIMIGLGLGLAVGLFFGELAAPLKYAGKPDAEMDEFIDNWVMLKRNDGTLDRIYDYWILGKGTELKEPCWSVIRDVLHWVD